MVLSKREIMARCKDAGLLRDYCEENIQTCSYDLRMGDEYYFYEDDGCKNQSREVKISALKKGGVLKIPPDAICYVITKETVNMPGDLTASISLSLGLIKCGVMLAAQPPYDPGYSGKTVALLHNLSNETVLIRHGQHILNIMFTKLSASVDPAQQYSGDYQGLNSLREFCQEVRMGAVFELRQELEREKHHLNKLMPDILSAISVTIALLTLLVTLFTSGQFVGTFWPKDEPEVPVLSVDREKNTLTVCVDGQSYEIEIQDSRPAEGQTD